MPLYKFAGNRILTYLQNKLSGLALSEYHSGYRLYSVHALEKIPFQSFTNTWHFDTQIILAMAERDLKIVERPIPTYYGDEICHVNGIPYAMHCILTSLRFWRNRRRRVLSYPGVMDIAPSSPSLPGRCQTPVSSRKREHRFLFRLFEESSIWVQAKRYRSSA
jgi:hypothetical protein